jgi:hypothetical protein
MIASSNQTSVWNQVRKIKALPSNLGSESGIADRGFGICVGAHGVRPLDTAFHRITTVS